jgi:hypothetical protein
MKITRVNNHLCTGEEAYKHYSEIYKTEPTVTVQVGDKIVITPPNFYLIRPNDSLLADAIPDIVVPQRGLLSRLRHRTPDKASLETCDLNRFLQYIDGNTDNVRIKATTKLTNVSEDNGDFTVVNVPSEVQVDSIIANTGDSEKFRRVVAEYLNSLRIHIDQSLHTCFDLSSEANILHFDGIQDGKPTKFHLARTGLFYKDSSGESYVNAKLLCKINQRTDREY